MLNNPLPGMEGQTFDSSYTILYKDYTLQKYPVEASYWSTMSGLQFPPEVTVFDLYQSFNNTGLFCPEVQQDINLGVNDDGQSNVFTAPNVVPYQRYLALNFGLGGWFARLTPKQVIEGY